MRTDPKKECLFISLSKYRPIVARDIDAPTIGKYPVHGMIIQKWIKWFLCKDIFPFDKLHANVLR